MSTEPGEGRRLVVPRYFAFLRAINVGGHTVTNDELRKLFAGAGFKGAETFIASGNVTFEGTGKAAEAERKLEAHLGKKLGYEVKTFLRTRDELEEVAAFAPFKPARARTAPTRVVGFLQGKATPAQKKVIAGFNDAESDFHVEGREVHWLCQTNQSSSAFFKVPFEKLIGAACTWRNRNTIDRILAKFPG
jgi:uncharacterized protein (DUF1697 family)